MWEGSRAAVDKYRFSGGTAVLTGAASGIGAALAAGLAHRGSDLALIDRDAAQLQQVAADLRAAHPTASITTHVADLAATAGIPELAQQVGAEHQRITLLINNAGVALGGRFDQVTLSEFEWVMAVNFRAVVAMTHAFLPALRSNPGSHLVNVSSIFGLIAPAGQSAYASSKFAVRGFTEALRHELPAAGVGVTVVHPGGVRTSIAKNARVGSGVDDAAGRTGLQQVAPLLTMDATRAAEIMLAGIERRRPRVLVGSSATIPDLVARLAPGSYLSVLEPLIKFRTRATG